MTLGKEAQIVLARHIHPPNGGHRPRQSRATKFRTSNFAESCPRRTTPREEAATSQVRPAAETAGMATAERLFDRGTRRGERALQLVGDEFVEKRMGLGLSQQVVAEAVHMSRSRVSRIERAKVPGLSIVDASRIASVLGLDLTIRAYPGPNALRDAAHASRLRRVLDQVRPPLRYRTEVPLPASVDRLEQRAWDAVIEGRDRRTTSELEMRIRDGQAVERRTALKRRDDPAEGFLLILADTHHNRWVLRENPGLFPDLSRLRPSVVFSALQAGRHPPTGLILV
jgi:transcriptional regulator with XRE-family HTH domain